MIMSFYFGREPGTWAADRSIASAFDIAKLEIRTAPQPGLRAEARSIRIQGGSIWVKYQPKMMACYVWIWNTMLFIYDVLWKNVLVYDHVNIGFSIFPIDKSVFWLVFWSYRQSHIILSSRFVVIVDVKFGSRRWSVDDLRLKKRFDRLAVHLQFQSMVKVLATDKSIMTWWSEQHICSFRAAPVPVQWWSWTHQKPDFQEEPYQEMRVLPSHFGSLQQLVLSDVLFQDSMSKLQGPVDQLLNSPPATGGEVFAAARRWRFVWALLAPGGKCQVLGSWHDIRIERWVAAAKASV